MLLRGVNRSTFTSAPGQKRSSLLLLALVTVSIFLPRDGVIRLGAALFKPPGTLLPLLSVLVLVSHPSGRETVLLIYDSARLFDHALDTALGTGNYSTLNSAGARVYFKRARLTPSVTYNSQGCGAAQPTRLSTSSLKTGDYSAPNTAGVCFKRARPAPCVSVSVSVISRVTECLSCDLAVPSRERVSLSE